MAINYQKLAKLSKLFRLILLLCLCYFCNNISKISNLLACLIYTHKLFFILLGYAKSMPIFGRIVGIFHAKGYNIHAYFYICTHIIFYARIVFYMHTQYFICTLIKREKGRDILYLSIRGILDVHVLFQKLHLQLRQSRTNKEQTKNKIGTFQIGRTNREFSQNKTRTPYPKKMTCLYYIYMPLRHTDQKYKAC